MALTYMLRYPDGATRNGYYKNAEKERVYKEINLDSGPLKDSGISSQLRVMILSSGHEVKKPGQLPDTHGQLRAAVFYYNGQEKNRDRMADNDPIVAKYRQLGVDFEGYFVKDGKHCPKVWLTIKRNDEDVKLSDAVLSLFKQHLQPTK